MTEIIQDSILEDISNNVAVLTIYNIFQYLEIKGLSEKDPDNNWKVKGNLTENGILMISNTIDSGLCEIFSRSHINYPPIIYFEQPDIMDHICSQISQKMGSPRINIKGNELNIQFNGIMPLIRSITGYLNPDISQPSKLVVKDLDIINHGIEINIPLYRLDN